MRLYFIFQLFPVQFWIDCPKLSDRKRDHCHSINSSKFEDATKTKRPATDLSYIYSGWQSKRSSTIVIHRRFFIVHHRRIRPIRSDPPSVIWSMTTWSSKWCPMDILLRLVFLTNAINLLYIDPFVYIYFFSFFFSLSFLLLLTFRCPYRASRGQVMTVRLLFINQTFLSLFFSIYIKTFVFFFSWSLIV